MKKKYSVFALGALMMFVVSCEKGTDGIDNKEEQGTENTDTFFVEAIDLGLSVKWASCNVGASAEDYGGYYGWGEVEETSTYKYWNDRNGNGYADSDEYEDIGANISGTSYDVAHVKWGDGWRMPTLDEIKELCNSCSWEWTALNGVNGYRITGPNGNSIFLPAAGYRYGADIYNTGNRGLYWSSSLYSNLSYYAYDLYFDDSNYGCYSCYIRADGRSVRPVSK